MKWWCNQVLEHLLKPTSLHSEANLPKIILWELNAKTWIMNASVTNTLKTWKRRKTRESWSKVLERRKTLTSFLIISNSLRIEPPWQTKMTLNSFKIRLKLLLDSYFLKRKTSNELKSVNERVIWTKVQIKRSMIVLSLMKARTNLLTKRNKVRSCSTFWERQKKRKLH